MNKTIKKKWVKALRSGEYKQGRNWLRKGDRFCCLGILCDLYHKDKPGSIGWKMKPSGNAYEFASIETGPEMVVLPTAVYEWAGLSSNNPSVHRDQLAAHNDGRTTTTPQLKQHSFNEIADLIENNL